MSSATTIDEEENCDGILYINSYKDMLTNVAIMFGRRDHQFG